MDEKPSKRLEWILFNEDGSIDSMGAQELLKILDELWEVKHKQYFPPDWYDKNVSKGFTGPCGPMSNDDNS